MADILDYWIVLPTRIHLGRRRGRASAGFVLLVLIPLVGYDVLRAELQKREEWTGTVVRVHSSRAWFGRRSSNRYWDVRTSGGDLRSVRIRPAGAWSSARVGDYVVKKAGQLNPQVIAHH